MEAEEIENMKLIFEGEFLDEPLEDDSLQAMCDKIPDDAMCVTIKVNLNDLPDDLSAEFLAMKPYINEYLLYITEALKTKVLYSSGGFHLLGKNKNAHYHFSLITERFGFDSWETKLKNRADHRKRWAKKAAKEGGHDVDDFSDEWKNSEWKIQPIDLSVPKFQSLAYPLKEGHSFPKTKKYFIGMSPIQIGALEIYGKQLYQSSLAHNIRQDKMEERKKNNLINLYELVEKNKNNFSSYHSMLYWLDTEYISSLELSEYPCPLNYKKDVQKIAVKLGFLKFSDLVI